MVENNAPTTPPGWYDDKTGTKTLRWWDGHQWTDNTAPMQDPLAPPTSAIIDSAPGAHVNEARVDEDDDGAIETPVGTWRAKSRGDVVTFDGSTVTLVFGSTTTPAALKRASPRVVPIESIDAVFYSPAGQWKIGSIRFKIMGDIEKVAAPLFDLNTVQIAAGRGAQMRRNWDELAAAVTVVVAAGVPAKVPLDTSRQTSLQEAAASGPVSARARAKEISRLNKTYPARHTEWQQQVARMKAAIETAETAHPSSDSNDIVLKTGEHHWMTTSGGLVDEVPGARTWVSGSRGVSVPIGKIGGSSIRYYAGSSKGHSEQAPPHDAVIDSGRIVVTDQRVVFIGAKRTRECVFNKMVSYDHEGVGNTTISVSNREKPTRLHYSDSNTFQIYFEYAVAAYRGVAPDVVEQLRASLGTLQDKEPTLLDA